MTKVPNIRRVMGITGAQGFLGFHLRALCHASGWDQMPLDRVAFGTEAELQAMVDRADVVVHLAGVNRASDAEVEGGNVRLAETLSRALTRSANRPKVIYVSSTHVDRDTPYGRGKRRAGEILAAAAAQRGCGLTTLVLPHVFGEFGRPQYNSVVATLCHQLSRREESRIDEAGRLELLHAQQVVGLILAATERPGTDVERPTGRKLSVREVYDRLKAIDQAYAQNLLPDLADPLTLDLFNTYRSYLFPDRYPVDIERKTDHRGSLIEIAKGGAAGQVFASTSHPGVVRGNHFHCRKVERYMVMKGHAHVQLRKLFSSNVVTVELRGDRPQYLDIPTFFTHNLINVGTEPLLTLFWVHEVFDPAKPDTYAEVV